MLGAQALQGLAGVLVEVFERLAVFLLEHVREIG